MPHLNLCHKQMSFVGLELVMQKVGHAFEQNRGVLSLKMEGGINLLIIMQVNHV